MMITNNIRTTKMRKMTRTITTTHEKDAETTSEGVELIPAVPQAGK